MKEQNAKQIELLDVDRVYDFEEDLKELINESDLPKSEVIYIFQRIMHQFINDDFRCKEK